MLVDEQGGIVAGHGRFLAAKKLGIVDVPVMVAAGWTEAQRRAYVLTDNRLAWPSTLAGTRTCFSNWLTWAHLALIFR